MLRRLLLLLLASLSFLMLPVGAKAQLSDELDVKLKKHVHNYDLGVSNAIEALIRLSSEFRVPMGITWVKRRVAKADHVFAWKDATVQQMIETIAKTEPGYQVQIKNGVVHVFLAGSIPERDNFLKTKIRSFNVYNTYTEIASLDLHNLITPPNYAGISVGADIEPKITVELKDTTVEDALDAICLASARKIWIVTFADDPALTAQGFRRSMSLWSNAPGADKYQPVWDLLHWGDKLPWASSSNK